MTSVIVRKNEIDVVSRETYTAGSVNVYTVNAKLSNEWKALSATPVFRAGNVRISTVFDEYGCCIIPHEVLARAGKMLEFGVYGVNDSGAELPTLWANLDYIREGTSPGDNAQDPTPSLYDQLVGQVGNAVTAARGYAEGAAASAETAGNAERGAGLSAGYAAESAEDAKTAALAAAKSETAADKAAKDAQTASEAAAKAAQGAAADKAAADTSASNAAEASAAASAAAAEATAARTGAVNAANASETARDAAAAAKTGAESAQAAAETARDAAETARDAAETAKTGAETARDAAEAARTGAETARDAAQGVVEDVKQGLNQIKDDLANKLPKSPADWEAWTDEEQAAAIARMGIDKPYELIEDITLTEEATQIIRASDTDGTPYSLDRLTIKIYVPANSLLSVTSAAMLCNVYVGAKTINLRNDSGVAKVVNSFTVFGEIYNKNGFWNSNPTLTQSYSPNSMKIASYSGVQYDGILSIPNTDKINNIVIKTITDGVYFPIGTNIKIYGVRA